MAACEYCRGRGVVLQTVIMPVLAAFPDATMVIHRNPALPCPACGGTGIASCCEGAVGGPAEVPPQAGG